MILSCIKCRCQPIFKYRITTSQSIPNETNTLVTGLDTNIETCSCFSFSNGEITINDNGIYLINAKICFTSNSTGNRQLYINYTKDASDFRHSYDVKNANSSIITSLNCNTAIKCDSTYKIKIYVYQNSGGSLNIHPNTTTQAGEITLIKMC